MAQALTFPEGFLLGGSFAANQVEGACREGGRGLSVWDLFKLNNEGQGGDSFTLPYEDAKRAYEDTDDNAYPKRRGIDHYHRWEADLDLFAEMGFKALRMSVSWSRIFPNGDDAQPNSEGIAHYRAVFEGLRARGIYELGGNLYAIRPDRRRAWRCAHALPANVGALKDVKERLKVLWRSVQPASQLANAAQVLLRHVRGLVCEELPAALLLPFLRGVVAIHRCVLRIP